MSETIDVGRYGSYFSAARHQQYPSGVIEAGAEDKRFATAYPSTFNVFEVAQPERRVYVMFGCVSIGKTAITADILEGVILITENAPAGRLVVVQNIERARCIEANQFWSEATGWHRWAANAQSIRQRPEGAHTPASAAKLRVERLSAIQAAMGLPVRVLAEVLHISRPGLYKWLDAQQDRLLQADNRQRLAVIEQLAKQWRARSNAPLSSVAHEPLASGHTVLEMLTAKDVDEAAVIAAFDDLVAKLQGKPKTLTQRMVESGFKRRPSHRSLPADD